MESVRPNNYTCKVLIIGGGAAGLSAANHLLKNNISDILVLEGRNRIGGRIIAITIDGRKMELGANWIHGVLGNPIYELASVNGLVDIIQENKPHNVLAALPNGQRIPFSILQEIYDAYFWFFKRCEEYFLCKYLPPDGIDGVGEHIKLEMAIYLQNFLPPEKEIRLKIFNYLLNRETCISGCNSMDEVDLMEIGSYTELPGGNILLPGGYSTILGPLTKDIPPDKIVKGHIVTKVRWRDFEECCATNGEDGQQSCRDSVAEDSNSCCSSDTQSPARKRRSQKVEVVCDNGQKFFADHVICTVPLGVLKEKGRQLFEPSLPDYKLDSIEKLCFGVVDKIYLEYERPFLSPDLTEMVLLWDEVDKNQPLSERWYKKIYSFSKITETLLLGWVSGEEAKYMESLPFDAVSEQCTEILRQFLNDPCIPKPKRCICTSWWSQPFTRGSYTAIAVGSSQVDITNIAHPLYADPMNSKEGGAKAEDHP